MLSLVFGTILVYLAPPLRGPDETAHFVRVYGLARGEIVPEAVDAYGRKGLWMPADMFRDFDFFESVRVSEKKPGFEYGEVFAAYDRRPPAAAGDAPERFVRYEGSEGYSLVAYLPQVVGAAIADLAGFDFLGTIYTARLAGLVGTTAVMALAAHLAGPLGWGFFAIAMLPSALYARSVLSADAMTTATALMMAALFLRAARGLNDSPAMRGLWLLLGAMSKPTNIVLVLPELLRRGWPRTSSWIVITPAVVAALLWTRLSSADVAAWRLEELYNLDAEQFEPAAKIAALIEDPWAFAHVLWRTVLGLDGAEKWTQVIGVLGLFDTVLTRLAYPLLTVLMIFALFARFDVGAPRRARVALVAAGIFATYLLALAAIFYLVWTPIDSPTIWGLQGRYVVPALPFAAIALAGFVDRAPPPWLTATFALSSAAIGGVASIEAVLRTDWGY